MLLSLRPGWLDPGLGETWAGWGGHCKEGELDADTAVRELQEETGYDGPITLFKCLRFHRPDQSFSYQNFIGVIPEEFEPEINMENEDSKWITMSELYGKDGEELALHPGFQECVIEAKPVLQEILKGLGILNEDLLRKTVRALIL